MNTDCKYGLSEAQVEERVRAGKKNITINNITKTKGEIVKDNVCTLFNALNVLIAVALALVGAWSNMVFILIIMLNIIIGIWQELKAKKLVEELSLLSKPELILVRNGNEQVYLIDDIVMDDIMLLNSGKQICCDSFIVSGELEVNESLLTGESDPVIKRAGDHLLSGSSVISGKCYAQVEHIGDDNYVAKLAGDVKKLRKINSELLKSMRKITGFTTFLIIPLGVLLFIQANYFRGDSIPSSVVASAAALLGMLPKGLVLLISVSLAGGVIKLAKKNVLIQDLYSLETLAHVDILCLDKTGTLTEGRMKVQEEYFWESHKEYPYDLEDIMGSFLMYSDDTNATFLALEDYYEKKETFIPLEKIPFSSQRKWSAICFENLGTVVIGAPERLLDSEMPVNLKEAIESGKRVIVMGITKEKLEKDTERLNVTPLAGIVITDNVRANAAETLDYFIKEGVEMKIISGDNPVTVSAVAKEASMPGYEAYINMDTVDEQGDYSALVSKYSIFGRTTPTKKKKLVEALKQNGHCVAMMGDGVNDLLALQEADCSIAVAEGSDAARQISQLVLLDSDFSTLPSVVDEGRRVITNVTKAAGVFFIKTIYSVILTIICIVLNIPFPFIPIQITYLDAVVEAYPAFLTTFEPNFQRVKGKFLPSAIKKSLPNALAIIISILIVMWATNNNIIPTGQGNTMAYLLVGIISMGEVIRSNHPFNRLRVFVCSTMVLGYMAGLLLFHSLLEVEMISFEYILYFGIIALIGIIAERGMSLLLRRREAIV